MSRRLSWYYLSDRKIIAAKSEWLVQFGRLALYLSAAFLLLCAAFKLSAL